MLDSSCARVSILTSSRTNHVQPRSFVGCVRPLNPTPSPTVNAHESRRDEYSSEALATCLRDANRHSFGLNTDGKIRSFAVNRKCPLAQVKRAIELVGADSVAVHKYLLQRDLTPGQPNQATCNAVGWCKIVHSRHCSHEHSSSNLRIADLDSRVCVAV